MIRLSRFPVPISPAAVALLAVVLIPSGCHSARIDPMEFDFYAQRDTESAIDGVGDPMENSRGNEPGYTAESPLDESILPAAAPLSVRLEKGDTLYALSLMYLGEGRRWREIADLNGLRTADLSTLHVGREIMIPPR